MPGNVLITGAYGFIGRHLARHYAGAGASVVGIGHGTWSREQWQRWGLAEWHAADVTRDSLRTYGGSPDVIVHCAGGGSVAYSLDRPYEDFERSAVTAAAVLEFARVHAPSARLVLPSSAGVYGATRASSIPESTVQRPVSPYGLHKQVAESLFRSHGRQYGLRTAIVRLFSVYGSGLRKQLLWDACNRDPVAGRPFHGTGNEQRDWLHVRDAAALLAIAAERASTRCPAVNGGTGAGVTVRDMLEHLWSCLERPGAPAFSGAARKGDPARYVADVARAQAWGWRAEVAWRDGVAEYARWFREGAH